MLLAQAERRLGIADQLARVIPDERDVDRVVYLLPDILRARIFAIACGYEDASIGCASIRRSSWLVAACPIGRDPSRSRQSRAGRTRACAMIRLMGVMAGTMAAFHVATWKKRNPP
jgi:hypothetical protein